MDNYIALDNLSNGIREGDTFPASRLSKFVITELLKKGRIRKVDPEPEAIPYDEEKPKKRKYTKRTEE